MTNQYYNHTSAEPTAASVMLSATMRTEFDAIATGFDLLEPTIVSVSDAKTFALTDDGKNTFLHPSADTTARTWTIDSNANVALPVGTEFEIVNQNAAGVLTISITTDTMRLSPGGTSGSRTLAANGWCRIKKITSTEWIIAGDGLT